MRTAAVLATALVVGLLGPAAGAAAPADRVTASASVPGKGYDAQTVVMPRGTATVTYSSAGLTKHVVGSRSVKRLGTAKVPKDPENRYYKRLVAHPAGGYVYLVWPGKVQIFDVSKRTPALVRTLGNGGGGAVFAPDGRRMFLVSGEAIRVLGTKNPARPTRGASLQLPYTSDTYGLAVTPDGSQLVATGRVNRGAEDAAVDDARVEVYSLPRVGAPVLERQATIDIPGWEEHWAVVGVLAVSAPDGLSAYLSISTGGEAGESPDEALVRVRLDDLSYVVLPERGIGETQTPFLQDVSANGNRVYFTYGPTTDEMQHVTRALAWTGDDLTVWHDAGPVGDVLATAVSKAGPTQGFVYVVVKTERGLQLRAVRVS